MSETSLKSMDTHNLPARAGSILRFWCDAGPQRWFAKDDAFDTRFRSHFEGDHFAAARGELTDWLVQPGAALALILLLDQFPRNAYRGTGHMFATDGLALNYAYRSLHFLDAFEQDMRNFLCLPFMHAEDLAMQDESVTLYEQSIPDSLYWARVHRDIIAQFGRFPHRNAVLGRRTTQAEQAFLDNGGFAG